MIIEDYCSYEIAKLLKEKGFDAEIHMYWGTNPANPKDTYIERCPKEFEVDNNCSLGHHPEDFECIAPTLQIAMKWLREVHHYFIEIHYGNVGSPREPEIQWWWELENKQGEFLEGNIMDGNTTYEEACETVIKYCLENLL